MSNLSIGTKYEKQVEKKLIDQGYVTHRMVKSRFGKQDLLTIADIAATKNDTFKLVACAVGRAQTETVRKIEGMKPFIPPFVKIEYWILKDDGTEEIREY